MRVRPHVGELLLLGGVHVHVVGPAVLAYDHPLVDLHPGADERLAPFLQCEQGIGVRGARPIADEHAHGPVGHLAGPRAEALADLVQERGSAGLGQELAAIPDQAAHRQHELEADPAVAVGRHLLETRLARGERGLHLADEVGRDVDRDPFVRLLRLPVHRAQDHLRPAHLELEPLAPHLLDQDGQLKLAAATDLERVCGLGRVDLDRDVAEHLAVESGLDLAARHIAAVLAGERRGVHAQGHAQRRRVDVQAWQRPRVSGVGDGVADRDLGDTRQRHDVAGAGLGHVDPLDAARRGEARHGSVQGHGAPGLDRAVGTLRLLAHDGDPLAGLDRAAPDAPDRHAPHVVVGGQVGDEELKRHARDV